VLELLRLVEGSGRVQPRLPESVGEVIGRRLDQLSATTRAALRLAAVIGREFTVAMLAAVAEQSPTELSDALDEAVAAEIATFVDMNTYRFTHVLIQEVLYAELPTALRLRSHALAAQALRPTDGGPRSIEALAHHLRQAAPIGGAPAALEMTLSAAVRARHQLAYEHAAFQYGEALRLLPLVPGDDGVRAELLLDLARCQFRSGAVESAWLSCQAAADIGRAANDGALVADAAIVLRGVTHSPLTKQIHAMCRDALAMLGDADRLRQAKVLAQLAITADPYASTDAGGASQRALQLAEASGDPDARFLALAARHTDLLNVEHVLERLSIGERAVRLGAETGREEYTAWGRSWRLDCFAELGRRTQFDAELAAFAAVVAQLREPLWRSACAAGTTPPPLPQPDACDGRARRPPDVRRHHHTVPRRRHRWQQGRMSGGPMNTVQSAGVLHRRFDHLQFPAGIGVPRVLTELDVLLPHPIWCSPWWSEPR
jgi:hypothetical protein